MSTNKSPLTSRYNKKQNYQSLNFPTVSHPLSPIRAPYPNQDHSAIKKSIQQKQIEDLQQKVDLILQHNDKLAIQNTELKRKILEAQTIIASNMQHERVSRYQIAEQSDYAVRKLNSELMIKVRELEHVLSDFNGFREITKKESESFREIINGLTMSNQTIKVDNARLSQQNLRIRDEAETDKKLAIKQTQRKMQQQIVKLQRQKSEELARQNAYHNKLVAELTQKFEEERKDWNNRKTILINKLQQNHTKEINQLREQMIAQFDEQIRRLNADADQKCKNQREKADAFIKEYMKNFGSASEVEAEGLKQQIKALQESLHSRKKFIDQMISQQTDNREDYSNPFSELLQMNMRLKEQMQHLMRESEMLKVKMAEQYQRDLKETVNIYQDKIQILSTQIRNLSDQNDRLRHNYQDQVTNRIRQRRNWEIEVGQLKNLIRKLKVELQGIQDQFKLNIEGVRDQNATFSMTLMKSMIQQRDKVNFHQQQNRKLRAMYDRHEAEVNTEKKQAQERIKFYQGKLDHLKKLMEDQKNDLREKEAMLNNKLNERELNLRENIKKERQRMQQIISQADQARQKLEKQYFDCRQKCANLQVELKQSRDDISSLTSRLKENEQHIERLRMELDMAGIDDTQRTDAINHWKQHYQAIVAKLQADKKELKTMIDSQNHQIQKLVYKYRILEEELKKAALKMQKKGQLDIKVIQLGLDHNLVKNISQLWTRGI